MRYGGIALVAVIAGAGGGYLAVNNKKESPPVITESGTLPAVPAQPYPGYGGPVYVGPGETYVNRGVPAIPAIPALPSRPDKTEENPAVSYIKSRTVDFGFNKQNEATPNRWADVLGTSFDPTNNAIYWDNVVIGRSGAGISGNYDSTVQQMSIAFAVPVNAGLGSTHSVSVKNNLGTSNAVQVRMVEGMDDLPIYDGVRPSKGPAGTQVAVAISPGKFSHPPLSAKSFIFVYVPANVIKSGATGYSHLFLPAPLTESGGSFTMPKEWVYCPSYLFPADQCALAPQDTKIAVPVGERAVNVFLQYEFKYAGTKRVSPLTSGVGQQLGFSTTYIFGN